MTLMYKDGSTKPQKGKKLYHCGSCDSVVDEKHLSNHSKDSISYLFAVDENDKEKKVDDIAQDEDKKKEKELESLKAELRGKSHEELDKIKEDLIAQIEELKKNKNESREAKRKRYDVLGYQQMNFDSQCGDDMMKELGSVD